jgi:heat shock protein HslJ
MTRPSSNSIVLLTRLLPLLIASVLSLIPLVGCGGSTDTGNPPFIEETEIRIVPSEDAVRVSGASGAVPAGAEVEVENLSTGESATTTAGDDGSFEVILTGSTADDYRVVVTSEGRSDSVTIEGGGTSLEEALLDRSFLLESAVGYTPAPGTTISVSFGSEGFGFSAGCNSHFGEYTLCDGKLCIQGLGSTAIGCDAAHSAQDEWLATFFTSQPQIALDGDTLTFTGVAATLVFLDRELANPDRPLTGRVWTVDTIIDNGAASNVPVSTPPTLEFLDGGTLNVFSGCNDIVYSYQVAGAEITLSLVSSTRLACEGAAGALSAHVSEVLTGTVTFEIEAQRLTLMNGTIGLGAMTD